jgi:hypothetical protein
MKKNFLVGQMTWRPNGQFAHGILHLRLKPWESWRPYTDFPEYTVPDKPGFSQGYTTFLALRAAKWQLL